MMLGLELIKCFMWILWVFFCSFIIQILGWNTKFGVGSKNFFKTL